MTFFFSWPLLVACGILLSPPGIELGSPEVKKQGPNHQTAREFCKLHILKSNICSSFKISGLCKVKSKRLSTSIIVRYCQKFLLNPFWGIYSHVL